MREHSESTGDFTTRARTYSHSIVQCSKSPDGTVPEIPPLWVPVSCAALHPQQLLRFVKCAGGVTHNNPSDVNDTSSAGKNPESLSELLAIAPLINEVIVITV